MYDEIRRVVNFVPSSLVGDAEGEIWPNKKILLFCLAAQFDFFPIPCLNIYAVFRGKLECVLECYKYGAFRRINNISRKPVPSLW